jgi:hypothetical protein
LDSKLLAICSQCVVVLICANAPTGIAAQTTSSVADFGELVKSFLIPANAVPSWNLGGHPAVRWESSGPKPAAADLVKDGLPMSRTGAVQITVDGQVTHRSDANQPGLWNVTLAGSSASPLEFRFRMDRQGAIGIGQPDALKAAGFKVKALCKPEYMSSGTALYEIEAAGYRPAVLAHEWSSGSAGTWVALTFAYTKERAAKLKCF